MVEDGERWEVVRGRWGRRGQPKAATAIDGVSVLRGPRAFEEKLRPDFVVVDGVLGCSDVPDDQYDDFMTVLKSNCKLQDQIDSKIYKPQLLYKCTS